MIVVRKQFLYKLSVYLCFFEVFQAELREKAAIKKNIYFPSVLTVYTRLPQHHHRITTFSLLSHDTYDAVSQKKLFAWEIWYCLFTTSQIHLLVELFNLIQ